MITLGFLRTLPAAPLDGTAQPLDASAVLSHLPPVTKAKAKAVRERGDATSHKVDEFSGRNVLRPGHQALLLAVGEHHP